MPKAFRKARSDHTTSDMNRRWEKKQMPQYPQAPKHDFRKLAAEAVARYDALSPSQKLRRDYMQRRSFVRGSCPDDRDFNDWCNRIDKTMPDEKLLTDTEIGLILAGSK